MRNYIKPVATVILLLTIHQAFSFQDSTRHTTDTLNGKRIQFTPYFSKESIRSQGNYVGVVDDSLSFQLSSGTSVFNVLRGQVPNIGISSYASYANVRENSIMVIDGLVYHQGAINTYNMNAFEYSNINVLSRSNAAAPYGANGANGAFILQSKTGENQFRPTIEFNSYSTILFPELSSSKNPAQLSNSIAFMQDFGKIDTRVSYNNFSFPNQHTGSHNIKINTGFDIAHKFNARLIIDNIYTNTKNSSSSTSTHYLDSMLIQGEDTILIQYNPYVVTTSRREKNNARFLQGNLILKYHPTHWLTLTSQSSWGRRRELGVRNQNNNTSNDENTNDRSLINFFARIEKQVNSSFSFSTFSGFQYGTGGTERRYYSSSNQSDYTSSYKDKYYVAGLDLNIHNFLYGDFIYRKDLFSFFPSDEQKPTYSSSIAFIFSDAFHLSNSFFSFGKLRSSIGKTSTDIENDGTNAPLTPEKVFELGTDTRFLRNRIGFTLNYFHEKILNPSRRYSPSTGYVYNVVGIGNLMTQGIEIILTAIPLKSNQFEYQTIVLWTRSTTTVTRDVWSGPSTPGMRGNPTPNWTSSLLNQITWKNFALRVLIDMRNGGSVITPNGLRDSGSQIKIRDISFSYNLGKARSIKSRFKQAQITLSARNILSLYSKSGADAEGPGSMYQKNISLGLSFML